MRIDPAAVLAACRQFPKCRVIQGFFGDRHKCGCPLTLFALSLEVPHGTPITEFLEDVGYDHRYIIGFFSAVDGVPQSTRKATENYKQGYADGTATRELLVREGVLR